MTDAVRPIRSNVPVHIHVHERGDARLDGILRLIEEAGRALPLRKVLSTLCGEIAEIARVDVVSVYLAEHDADGEVLVMRANVGLSDIAVGNVRLRGGEGLTGFAAECMRPVSVGVARHDEHYKHVPGIGEEHFPSYLGIPLMSAGAVAGVLVLQRREAREFVPAEVALATAVAAPVAFALERAQARADERDSERGVSSSGRSARLDGVPLAPGVALGRADVLAALDGLASGTAGRELGRPGDDVALSWAKLARELERARRVIEPTLPAALVARVRALALILEDDRFRELVLTSCRERGVAGGLAVVAREYARAPYRVTSAGDPESWLTERAAEIEDLCALIGSGRTLPAAGTIVVAERLTGLGGLAAVARRAVGIALTGGRDESAFGAAIARAAGIPVVAEVGGLYAWARPDDRMIVDGDAGIVRVNPPATVVAKFRAKKV